MFVGALYHLRFSLIVAFFPASVSARFFDLLGFFATLRKQEDSSPEEEVGKGRQVLSAESKPAAVPTWEKCGGPWGATRAKNTADAITR